METWEKPTKPWSNPFTVTSTNTCFLTALTFFGLQVLQIHGFFWINIRFVWICSVVVSAPDWTAEDLLLAAHTFVYSAGICVFKTWTECDWSKSLQFTCVEFSRLSLQCGVKIWDRKTRLIILYCALFFYVNSLFYFFITFLNIKIIFSIILDDWSNGFCCWTLFKNK